MTLQGNETAETPAGTDADTTVNTGDTSVSSGGDDGIIDLDTLADEKAEGIESGSLEGDDPEADEAKAKLAETPADTEEEAKKKLTGSQRAKLREQRLLDDIAARDRELETLRASRTTETKAPAAGGVDPDMPKEADFNGDYFAFTEAKTAYTAAKAAREAAENVFKSREDAISAQRTAEEQRRITADHLERVDAAKAVITDYDEVMEGMKGVNVTDSLIGLIKASDNSAVIAYKLANDPALLKQIDRMTPLQQAKEIGKLEVSEKLPERKTVTKADPPLTKSKGNAPAAKSQEAQLSSWLDKQYPNRKK